MSKSECRLVRGLLHGLCMYGWWTRITGSETSPPKFRLVSMPATQSTLHALYIECVSVFLSTKLSWGLLKPDYLVLFFVFTSQQHCEVSPCIDILLLRTWSVHACIGSSCMVVKVNAADIPFSLDVLIEFSHRQKEIVDLDIHLDLLLLVSVSRWWLVDW